MYRKIQDLEKIDTIVVSEFLSQDGNKPDTRQIQHRQRPIYLITKTRERMSTNVNTLFGALPNDLQNKIYEKIVYPQSKDLLYEIKMTRMSSYFHEMQKVYIKNPKKFASFKDTVAIMRANGHNKQADKFELIINEIVEKQDKV